MMDEFSDELAEFTPGIENFYVQLGNTGFNLTLTSVCYARQGSGKQDNCEDLYFQ